MDLQKGKILLDKINALYGSMNSDSENIASIEKDLMRSYVRQFYEVFTETEKVATSTETRYQQPPVVRPAAPVVQKVKTVAPPPPEPKHEQPRIIELSNDVQEFVSQNIETQPVTMAPPKPAPSPPPAPVATVQPTVRKEVIQPTPPTPTLKEQDEEVLDLFEHKKAADLSERLSSLPVRDLRQAMGLNERILTVNELFGGDNTAFNTAMSDLNKLNSFEEAKNYLAQNIIPKYNWTTKENKKKAKILIKTIRRRYS